MQLERIAWRPSARARLTTIAAAAAATTLVSTSAALAADWTPTRTVTTNTSGTLYAPSVAADGTGLTVFTNDVGSIPTIRTLGATGTTWNPGTALTATQTGLKNLKVAIAPNGEGAAVWELPLADRTIVRGSTRSPAGAWSTPVNISADTANTFSTSPDVAIDGSGNATVVWSHFIPANPGTSAAQSQAYVATKPAGVPSFTFIANLLDGNRWVNSVKVAVNADGKTAVVVGKTGGLAAGDTTAVETYARMPGGNFYSVGGVGMSGSPIETYDVTVGPTGLGAMTYSATSVGGGTPPREIRLFAGTVNGQSAWTIGGSLSNSALESSEPSIAVDANDNITVAWAQTNALNPSIVARTRFGVNGGLTPITNVTPLPTSGSDPGTASPQIIAVGDGTLTMGYLENAASGNNTVLRVKRRSAIVSVTDGAWSSPTTVGSLGDGLGGFDLAALSTNESAIVWGTQVGTSSTYELKSAYFDNTAPTLGGFTTANLVATKPASFSVTTSDRWTTAPTVTWDFDDGTTGTGTNPTHTYALPGNYRVTITTTDEFGNSTSQEQRITVASAPTSGGTGGGTGGSSSKNLDSLSCKAKRKGAKGVQITCMSPTAPTGSVTVNGTLRRFKASGKGAKITGPVKVTTTKGSITLSFKPKKRLAKGRYVVELTQSGPAGTSTQLFTVRL